MEAAHPAPPHSQPVSCPYPDPRNKQNARLGKALHARLFADRLDLREFRCDLDLPTYEADLAGHEKIQVLSVLMEDKST